MSRSTSAISPVVPSPGTTGETVTYPHRWLGSVNPIHEPTNIIIPTSTSTQPFLTTHGFSTTPIAIYTMHFEDGPRVKGQPKMFHANFTHPHAPSPITIDGKVYTHKAFSNQQSAYRKDRYGLIILSPTLCYTMYGIVDNEKKRQERIARELRIDGEEKCNKKKRRQVFKINDSAVMMLRDGWDGEYPTYAFNTNATYTIAFYARDIHHLVSHTGVRYTHNEHDVFVHITASHGGMIVKEEEKLQVVPVVSRKRIRNIPTVSRKRRHSETSEDSVNGTPISPVSPSHSITSSCVSPTSPDSHIEHEFPITEVSHQSFVSEKRTRMEEPYAPYAINPYDHYDVIPSISPVITHSTSTLPTTTVLHPVNSPLPLPSLDYFSSESMDPFITYDDPFPDIGPTLMSLPSLSQPYDFNTTSTSLFAAEMESEIPWLM